MLIAVASKTGTDVDLHFGHAERFLIYDYGGGSPEPVKEVHVDKYCSYNPDHPFRHRQFDAIVTALEGCRAVVTAMIGELPRQQLEKAGIRALTTRGAISEALKWAHDQVCPGGCSGNRREGGDCPHH
ncbi:MAG: dinitrogenase iron-molybdenum cofactor biosynthesis protein [Deltaproteobacteria bacterium]|nr:MAG: dinitrogenase iron-molybdenum cofactor biosynthesis protein [Deltaproteobacteria bacterium]